MTILMLKHKNSLLLAVSFSYLSNTGVKIEMTSLACNPSVWEAEGKWRASRGYMNEMTPYAHMFAGRKIGGLVGGSVSLGVK